MCDPGYGLWKLQGSWSGDKILEILAWGIFPQIPLRTREKDFIHGLQSLSVCILNNDSIYFVYQWYWPRDATLIENVTGDSLTDFLDVSKFLDSALSTALCTSHQWDKKFQLSFSKTRIFYKERLVKKISRIGPQSIAWIFSNSWLSDHLYRRIDKQNRIAKSFILEIKTILRRTSVNSK